MTSSDSSSSVRVVSSPGSRETSRCDPEVGSSGASSGPPSPVDARVPRDLEVMKSDHDLDTTVTEGSLVVIRERYSIPIEYGLHVPQPGQRPYNFDTPGMCISFGGLGSTGRHTRSQRLPVLIRGGNRPGRQTEGNSFLFTCDQGDARALVNRIDLRELRWMPKVTSDKVPPTHPTVREVGASPAREAPKASLKRLVVTPTEQAEDAARRHKKVKVLTRRHKSHLDEGESHSRSKSKEPATPSKEPRRPPSPRRGALHRPTSVRGR
ncbi:hypothetical protein B296_00001699 [Ensete ventricosum]|uniref:Uncharacterized protein n=1 Tax=Ensete ventricosum TaxID=4639 RepID=A0A426ZWA2_ENSVE|nr:hypothetical protein B296_00001699 [Ensete ventricosum]